MKKTTETKKTDERPQPKPRIALDVRTGLRAGVNTGSIPRRQPIWEEGAAAPWA